MPTVRTGSKAVLAALAGAVVAGCALAGGVYGVRAAVAQAWYYRAKYSEPPADCAATLALCEKAFRLYPHNYYFSIVAAERAYYAAAADVAPARRRAAELWCDRGLAQNSWKSQLRRLKARFLWEQSPARAIAYWQHYTDWQFWEPHNHAVLAEMYAQAGDLDRAAEALYWARGDSHADAVRALIRDAEASQEKAALKDVLGEWGE